MRKEGKTSTGIGLRKERAWEVTCVCFLWGVNVKFERRNYVTELKMQWRMHEGGSWLELEKKELQFVPPSHEAVHNGFALLLAVLSCEVDSSCRHPCSCHILVLFCPAVRALVAFCLSFVYFSYMTKSTDVVVVGNFLATFFFISLFCLFNKYSAHTARSVFKNPEIYVRNLPVSPPGTCATSCGSAHTCGLPRQLAVDQAAATPGLRRSRERCLETKSYLWNAEGGTGSAEPLTTGLLFGEWSFLWFVGKTSSQYEAAKGQPSPTLVRSSSCSHSASCSSMPRCTRVRSKWLWFLLPYAYAPYLEAATQGDID